MAKGFKFKVTGIREAYRHKVQRWAVFTPIFGTQWHAWTIPETLNRLRRLWCKRVRELAKIGSTWLFDDPKRNCTFAFNCPPFGVITRDSTRTCNHPLVCPFCFARIYVQKFFCDIEQIVYGSTAPDAQPLQLPPDLIAMSFLAQRRFRPQKGKHWNDAMASEAALVIPKVVRKNHGLEVDWLKAKASFVIHRVEPGPYYTDCFRSGILIIERNRYTEEAWDDQLYAYRPEILPDLSRATVARSLRKICAYPREMLLGNPERAAELLLRLNRQRMYFTHGKPWLQRLLNKGRS